MTLSHADPSQFQLTETGHILFQRTLNNPTLGDLVAKIVRGETIYTPKIELLESDHIKGTGQEISMDILSKWILSHIGIVLEPLKRLENTEILRKKEDSDDLEPVVFPEEAQKNAKVIMDKIHAHMGILHRTALEEDIQKLDEESRRILRAKRVRLGPILVFLPELNKPKTVRLRGLLWSVWNDQPLPAPLPADGAVSVRIEPESVNKDLHLAVSYPVFANRAIRIDMLDRVINAIYESAKEGKFQAQHAMAEWLGCSIDDLYDILSAMGHKRIVSDAVEKKEGQEKPVLDLFWLKKGQAHKESGRHQKPKIKTKEKKPFKKKPYKKTDDKPRVISAQAETRPEDNPFSILEQLK